MNVAGRHSQSWILRVVRPQSDGFGLEPIHILERDFAALNAYRADFTAPFGHPLTKQNDVAVLNQVGHRVAADAQRELLAGVAER